MEEVRRKKREGKWSKDGEDSEQEGGNRERKAERKTEKRGKNEVKRERRGSKKGRKK
jgi:hypothetical protein